MVPTTDLPGLLGSDVLLQFLKDGLQQIEDGQGHADDEARHLLNQLQQQTAIMQALAEGQQEQQSFTDLQLAEQIDSLDAQLAQLEATLSSADHETKQLLGQSAARWMGSTVSGNHDDQNAVSTRDTDTTTVSSNAVPESAADASTSSPAADGAMHSIVMCAEQQQVDPNSNTLNHKEELRAISNDVSVEGTVTLVCEAAAQGISVSDSRGHATGSPS